MMGIDIRKAPRIAPKEEFPDDFMLIVSDGGREIGRMEFDAEPDKKYLEGRDRSFENETAFSAVLGWLRRHYSGWRFDLYGDKGENVIGYARSLGFTLGGEETTYTLDAAPDCPDDPGGFLLTEKYYDAYRRVHLDDCYWKADLVIASENFRVFIIPEGGEVAAYIDVGSTGVNEIYQLQGNDAQKERLVRIAGAACGSLFILATEDECALFDKLGFTKGKLRIPATTVL